MINKTYLLSLAISQPIKEYLFKLYYDHYLKSKGVDKKMYNILTIWNM